MVGYKDELPGFKLVLGLDYWIKEWRLMTNLTLVVSLRHGARNKLSGQKVNQYNLWKEV